ncbi:MAG: hypothetical protein ACR5K4_03380 [Sodalis sp. (in: enterobacteria)]
MPRIRHPKKIAIQQNLRPAIAVVVLFTIDNDTSLLSLLRTD